ncbi:hypothetical protein BS47DRAFT_1485744 [Hydnum rufescens UP504]|uniref:TLC domain-containing protein n=1 Tax=Hydnum rufescens UP504 TaxID=1448309 RepID=A0A9P6AWP6_9AGAM|nr:hypothetical protein BS47DRAFT_1485744 [Hydnum rufescens UP504]
MRRKKSSWKPEAIIPSLGLGIWSDLKTMAWMTAPMSSFKMLLIPVVLWTNWHFLAPHIPNPFAPLLFVSYPIADSDPGSPRFAKGPLDILFVAYYVIVWSFVRQFLTLHILHPLAIRFGVRKSDKVVRFGEQGYAYVMSQLPTWWFRTEHFWIDYPHWRMMPLLKRYYLMQFAYWLQQLLVLALRLEKPRKDFTELVIHHFVAIWLVFWSYTINLTYIGNAVFLTMDVSDVVFSFAKVCKYLEWETTAAVAFSAFVCVWTYLRHFLNIKIIWSVWTQWKYAPEYSKRFEPKEGVWMARWVQYQVMVPMIILQLVNIFWYYLILRVLRRALFGPRLEDDRSDDEDEGPDVHGKDE